MAARKKAVAKKAAGKKVGGGRRTPPTQPVATRGSGWYYMGKKGFVPISIKKNENEIEQGILYQNKTYGPERARQRRNEGRLFEKQMRKQFAQGRMAATSSKAKRIERADSKKNKKGK